MNTEPGATFIAMMLGVVLASLLAWLVAWLYQRRMLNLMRGGATTGAAGPAIVPDAVDPGPWGVAVDLQANRRATVRLMLVIAGLALLIGLTQSTLALFFIYLGKELTLSRALVLGAIYGWPMVLGWGLARRWSWARTLAAIAVYVALMILLVMWRSTSAQSLNQVSGWIVGQIGVPMVMVLLIGVSGRIRAVAPYLLPGAMMLTASSIYMLEVMASVVQQPPAWVYSLVGTIGAYPTIALTVVLPWLVVAWPVYWLGGKLAAAYRAKRFSDLVYLIGAYWFVILFTSSLPAMASVGLTGFVELLAWLWIPLLTGPIRSFMAPPPEPPTLLVLRVFQQDAQVETLFDQVIERWRLTGNTVLIAGTDLLSRTLDPDDLFSFLGGHLADRFVSDETKLVRILTDLDLRPDPDGRYRVNELYCYDTTWQAALAALVRRAHVVLMDLRGFQPHNHGCRHELGVLTQTPDVRRVVLLHDAHTARQVAEGDIAQAPAGRFIWLNAERMGQGKANEILEALLAPTSKMAG